MTLVRKAEERDLEQISAIYNHAILHTTATFDVQPKTFSEQQRWFESHRSERYPLFVAEVNSRVAGWASLSAWSDRCAYGDAGETSFYVDPARQGQGIGRALLEELVATARQQKFYSLLARMAEGSAASAHLHLQLGFQLVGCLKKIGYKFDRRLDVEIYQKLLQ